MYLMHLFCAGKPGIFFLYPAAGSAHAALLCPLFSTAELIPSRAAIGKLMWFYLQRDVTRSEWWRKKWGRQGLEETGAIRVCWRAIWNVGESRGLISCGYSQFECEKLDMLMFIVVKSRLKRDLCGVSCGAILYTGSLQVAYDLGQSIFLENV